MAIPQIKVKVGKVPGKMGAVEVPEGSTVADVIKAAEITDAQKYQLRLNSQDTQMTDKVKDGATVLLINKVQGNHRAHAKQ